MKAYCIGKPIILPYVRYINNGKLNRMKNSKVYKEVGRSEVFVNEKGGLK
jgi:hypothetical protein